MSDHKEGKLFKETEWNRWYDWGSTCGAESKFLTDGLKVSAESIRTRWPTLSDGEKLDFAMAFVAGRKVPVEEEPILDFLMEAVEEDLDHIVNLGGVPKDLDEGLVDFLG